MSTAKRVVIIGAGVGGMCAGALLARRGFEVTVCEASDVVGGRTRTQVIDGYSLPRGAVSFQLKGILPAICAEVGAELPRRRARYFPRFRGSAVRLASAESWDIRIAAATETRLRDEHGGDVTTANTPGEFACRSPAVFPGYFTADGTLDRCDFDADGYFRTGEIFEIAGPGEEMDYYNYLDRLKDVINRGGQKIPVGEIEAAMQSYPAVREACAIAVRDERLGERVCAVIVPVEGETVTLGGLVAYLRTEGVSTFMLPEQLAIVDVLPRNPTGKILKRLLSAQIGALADA